MSRGTIRAATVLAAAFAYVLFESDFLEIGGAARYLVAGLAAIFALVGLAGRVVNEGKRRTGSAVLGLASDLVQCAALVVLLEWGLRHAEALGLRVPGLATSAALLLRALGVDATAGHGVVYLPDGSGAIAVLATLERLTPRPFALVVLGFLLLRRGAPGTKALLLSLLATSGILLLTYTTRLVVLAGWDDLYGQSEGSVLLTVLGTPWILAPALIALAAVLSRIPEAPLPARSGANRRSPLSWMLASATGAVLVLVGCRLDPPGAAKDGLIVFDDGHNGAWGRSDRRMDTSWYGDYSTYNLASAVEWLGHRFPVATSRRAAIDDTLLADASVLVLKTPALRFSDAEVDAIERFVRRGGGLLAIGDHTDLHGMNTQLNRVLRPFGFRLGFDAASDGSSGAFNAYARRSWPPAEGFLAAIENLEFMTSCSVAAERGDAQLMIVPRCALDEGDYANGSNFGARRSDPALHTGPTPLAAAGTYGRGRVSVFTDGTVMSGFALYNGGHGDYLLAQISWLARESPPWWGPLRVALILLGWSLAAFGWRFHPAQLPATGLALLLTGAGIDAFHVRAYAAPPPGPKYREVEILWQGGSCAIPQSLGSIGSLDPKLAFDTMLTSVSRCGVWPRIVRDHADALSPRTEALFVVNPVWAPRPEFVSRLARFVAAGGDLVVLDRYAAYPGSSSAREFVRLAGGDLEVEVLGNGGVHLVPVGFERVSTRSDLDLFVRRLGEGRVYFGVDSGGWSRQGLGHAFNLPGDVERRRLSDLYALVREVSGMQEADRAVYGVIEDRTP
jgi:hypothetical protein